jgi:hypothetical protein
MAGRPRTRLNRKQGIICGAKNRRGLPCQCKLLLKGGRCKFHGGMSTGPKTAEGKRRIAEAVRARIARDRAAKAMAEAKLAPSYSGSLPPA